MSNKIIKSVEKGWGESSTFFTTNEKAGVDYRVDRIEESQKKKSPDLVFNTYVGYVDGSVMFEMGVSIDVTAIYEQ